MKTKSNDKIYLRIVMIGILMGFFALSFFLANNFFLSNKNFSLQSKAQTVAGIETIQQLIDSAKDGETVTIPAGTYSGPTAIPIGLGDAIYVSSDRGASKTCFLKIENKKNLVIKGAGATLFGEGHDKPYQDPYQNRAGVCVINSSVIFDGLHVKEFQKRCMVVYNSSIVYKNGIVDGCDEGGISMLGNSTGLIVNNLIAELNFGGVMLWQNSQAKIINNTFYDTGVMFFYHPSGTDKMKAEIINNIIVLYTNFAGRASITQVEWWKDQIPRLKENIVRNNIFWKGEYQCWDFELCDFPGKINADPLFIEPVTDPRGIAAWANFGVKEGSPALGAGDPAIPGPKNIGHIGGPCVDPNSSICSSFIKDNLPVLEEEPTIAPTQTLSTPNLTVETVAPPNQKPTVLPSLIRELKKVTPTPLQSNESQLNKKFQTSFLTIHNKNSRKQLMIKAFVFQNEIEKIEASLSPNQSMQIEIKNCPVNEEVNAGILYGFSEDWNSFYYKNLLINCKRQPTVNID